MTRLRLAAAAGLSLWRRGLAGADRVRARAVAAPLAVLTLLALSPLVFAGRLLVLRLPLWPWDQVFAPVRSSGRAFWVVGYALTVGSVALLSGRLPRRVLAPLLAASAVLQ